MPDAAPDRQLSGYELLGDRIGKGRFTLAQPLGCVFYYREQQGLPSLIVLVVTKHGRPGSGFPGTTDPTQLDELREQVFSFEWDRLFPLTSRSSLASASDGNRPGQARCMALRRRCDFRWGVTNCPTLGCLRPWRHHSAQTDSFENVQCSTTSRFTRSEIPFPSGPTSTARQAQFRPLHAGSQEIRRV